MADPKLKKFIIVDNAAPLFPSTGKGRGRVYSKAVKELLEAIAKGDTKLAEKIARKLDPDFAKGGMKKLLTRLGIGGAAVSGGAALGMGLFSQGLEQLGDLSANVFGAMEQSLSVNIPESLGELAAEFIKLRVNVQELQIDVGRATGQFEKLGGQIETVTRLNRTLGVTFERTAKAMMELDSGFSLLGVTTERQRQQTLRLTFALENLGVAASDTGKGLEVFARGTSLSEEAARKSVERLIQLGRQISYKGGPAQMMRDIAEIGPMIAKFGTSSEQVMADLAVHARKTGLEMRQIFDVADQFDTFEGALEAAGKLNAQFGLGLSSVALSQADDAERRQIIVDRFHELYGSFDNLDRRQKQFMGETLGFGKNIQDTRKYFEEAGFTREAVTGLMPEAERRVKLSEAGQAGMEQVIAQTVGGITIPGQGKIADVSDKMVNSFRDVTSATQTFTNTLLAVQGSSLLELGFKGLMSPEMKANYEAMKSGGILAVAATTQASQAAQRQPGGAGFGGTRQGLSSFKVTGQNPDGSQYSKNFRSEAEARQFLAEKRREAEAAGYKVNESETVIERSVPPRRPPMRTGTPGSQPPMVTDPQTGQPVTTAGGGFGLDDAGFYTAAGGYTTAGGLALASKRAMKGIPQSLLDAGLTPDDILRFSKIQGKVFEEGVSGGMLPKGSTISLTNKQVAEQLGISVKEAAKLRTFRELGEEGVEQAVKSASKFKSLARAGGKLTGPAAVGLELYFAEDAAQEKMKERPELTAGQARAQTYGSAGGGLLAIMGSTAAIGAAAGSPTGPGAILTGLAGAIVGAGIYYGFGVDEAVEEGIESLQDIKEPATAVTPSQQRANDAIFNELQKVRGQAQAVGDQASLDTSKRNLIININGNKIHEQDITNVFDPSGTKRIPVDRPFDVGVMPA